MQHSGFETAAEALDFIFAGKACFTITSAKTGKHFTYKVTKKEDTPFFVSVLNGPDNWTNYQYIGFVRDVMVAVTTQNKKVRPQAFGPGRSGHPDAPSYKAFSWMLAQLHRGTIPADLTIQNEGKCCVCARKLTHPDSIQAGIGPDCAAR